MLHAADGVGWRGPPSGLPAGFLLPTSHSIVDCGLRIADCSFRNPKSAIRNWLTAAHAVSAGVAEVAISVSYGDGAAVVAAGGVALEIGELFLLLLCAAVAVDLQRRTLRG